MNIPDIKLAQVVDRFEQIEARMGATTDSTEIVQLGKDYAELRPVVEGVRALQSVRSEMEDLKAMLDDPEMGQDMRDMAKEEFQSIYFLCIPVTHSSKAGRSRLKATLRQIWAVIKKLLHPFPEQVFTVNSNLRAAFTACSECLWQKHIEKQRVDAERADERKDQVGSGDRSARIRTYNYPQGRLTDHRINLTLYKLDKIVAGDELGDVIDALISEDQANRLAAMEADGWLCRA